MNNDENDLSNLTYKICEHYSDSVQERIKQVIINRCTRCRWAKVCNPHKNVPGIETSTKTNPIEFPKKQEYTNFFISFEVRFHCDKFKMRKKPIAFEETRIWKLSKGEN